MFLQEAALTKLEQYERTLVVEETIPHFTASSKPIWILS